MNWIDIKKEKPVKLGQRVLTCDSQEKDPVKRYRIIDAQFIKFCTDVTHWMYIEEPI